MLITFNKFIKLKKLNKNKINKNKKLFIKYISSDDFDEEYIDKIINQKNNIFYVYIISGDISSYKKFDDVGFVIVRKIYHSNIIKYAIPLLGIHSKVRNYGYGSILLEELELHLKNDYFKDYYFVLHSLQSSINFYKRYGFSIIKKNKYLQKIEELKPDDVLMEYKF